MKVSVFLFFLITLFHNSISQVTLPPVAPVDTMKIVHILNANRYGYFKKDSLTELQTLAGKVQLKQENTIFSSDSAVYNKNAGIVEAFGNIHINDADSIHTFSQYLLYHVNTKKATLRKKVRLTDGKTNLYTEELEYDLDQKIGTYTKGGRVTNANSVLTSKEGTYYADLKDVYFKNNVHLKDPAYNLDADSLLYNTTTQIATFISNTFIEDSSKRTIRTTEGFYDLKNRKAYFGNRSKIRDKAVTIIANEVETDDSTGISRLRGNAVFKDTAQGVAVLANFIESNRNEGTFFATQHPLMIIKQENDSIYITADTLFSGRLSKLNAKESTDTLQGVTVVDNRSVNDSADRYFQAYRHVRIFSDSLQAVSDSLFYSGKDSIFQLFKNPIVWANQNQVTGDTMYLYTKNKKAERLDVFENGLVINKAGENMFNQVKGNRLNGYFTEGVINYMRAKGNAESVYYVKDDEQSLVGINRATGNIIDLRFKDKELDRVIFISDVKGTMFPLSKISEEDKTLRNFHWYEASRPKTKYELFGD